MPLKEEKLAAALDAPGVVEMQVGGAKKALDEMTPKDVAAWLDGQGLGHLGQAFIKHKISGAPCRSSCVSRRLNSKIFDCYWTSEVCFNQTQSCLKQITCF